MPFLEIVELDEEVDLADGQELICTGYLASSMTSMVAWTESLGEPSVTMIAKIGSAVVLASSSRSSSTGANLVPPICAGRQILDSTMPW